MQNMLFRLIEKEKSICRRTNPDEILWNAIIYGTRGQSEDILLSLGKHPYLTNPVDLRLTDSVAARWTCLQPNRIHIFEPTREL